MTPVFVELFQFRRTNKTLQGNPSVLCSGKKGGKSKNYVESFLSHDAEQNCRGTL